MTFDHAFEALTDHAPFPWQQRVYHEWFAKGEIPLSSNLPTGLGKTSVIPIWLIALANAAKVPRRLVYVVNRRTVVDQTTAEVERIRNNIEAAGIADALRRICCLEDNEVPLAISTLRGQFADNRQWSADPSRPAVICGTVDMIGSRLLFSGYRLGFKSRPLHAGFLGQDVLLVHDEAHLEPAFQNLITGIEKEQDRERQRSGELPWPKLRVMQLTATTRNDNGQGTQAFALTAHDQEHPVVKQRLEARKQLDLIPVNDDKQVASKIAKIAAGYNDANAAVLVYVRTLEAVGIIERELKKTGRPLVLLTGTIRGRERDDLVEKPEFQRFLKGAETGETVYLVCTSAGEVGIDISADHMVCDLSTFESMAQRFGRVNRFGDRDDTRIDVVYPETFDDKNKLTPARQATLRLLDEQLKGDASPLALSKLDIGQRQAAFAPEPAMLDATDILFDAWTLTTIRDKMPGRPPVAPYLHGVAEWEPFQTSVAWREEVEVLKSEELLERYEPADVLEDYPLEPHELLHDATDRRGSGVFAQLSKIAARHPDAPVWIIDSRGQVKPTTLQAMINSGNAALHDATVLLPPHVGGLSNSGTLDGDADHDDALQYDVADEWFEDAEKRVRRRVRVWNEEQESESTIMQLVRRLDFPADDEDEDAEGRAWHWFELTKTADSDGSKSAQRPVKWDDHTNRVTEIAVRIGVALDLPRDLRDALRLAAKFHDLGKRRELWQRSIGNPNPTTWYAKSGRDPQTGRLWRPLDITDYRHEFGSLLDIQEEREFREQSDDVKDLILHLVASGHGRGRPHFPADEAFDPEPKCKDVNKIAVEVVQRFARLQRKYGRWGLAYLESLLRAADWAASAEPSHFITETEEVSL